MNGFMVSLIAAGAAMGGLAGNIALGAVYTDSPGVTITLAQTSPGIYGFTENYDWSDQNVIGPWAANTFLYSSAGQENVANTVDLASLGAGIDYRFIVPVDSSLLDQITFTTTDRGGVTLRYGKNGSDLYTHDALTIPGSTAYETKSAEAPSSSSYLDESAPGQVVLYVRYQNESGSGFGSVDHFSISASTVPEPASLALLGLGGLLMLRRRR